MVEDIFKPKKDIYQTKNMYDKIAQLTNIKKQTTFVIPGESFIISNKQWKQLMAKEIKKEDLVLITDKELLEKEYHEFIEDQL